MRPGRSTKQLRELHIRLRNTQAAGVGRVAPGVAWSPARGAGAPGVLQ